MRIGLIGVGRIGAFHAATLRGLAGVDSVIVTDADLGRARQVAGRLSAQAADSARAAGSTPTAGSARIADSVQAVDSVRDLLAADVDGLVIATATNTHLELIRRGIDAGLPVFCEKPVAPDVDGALKVIKCASEAGTEVQVGFQRRFDAGFQAAREAARSGSLGWLHTIRSTTLDAAPPPAEYVPGSGGIFRDCAVHDFDAIRWLTGHEIATAYAAGANRGEDFFRAAGDVDTASAILTLDDGALAVVSCTRYNGAGYDVRLEVLGSAGSVCAGLDDRTPLRSAEPGSTFPAGPAHRQFMARFDAAYRAELAAFIEVAAGHKASPCTPQDALEASYVAEACELSRHRGEPVEIAEVRR
jgi:myo-inositol 2-dehydrogenase / D-chiro-inositol 1-dehydrogenase